MWYLRTQRIFLAVLCPYLIAAMHYSCEGLIVAVEIAILSFISKDRRRSQNNELAKTEKKMYLHGNYSSWCWALSNSINKIFTYNSNGETIPKRKMGEFQNFSKNQKEPFSFFQKPSKCGALFRLWEEHLSPPNALRSSSALRAPDGLGWGCALPTSATTN